MSINPPFYLESHHIMDWCKFAQAHFMKQAKNITYPSLICCKRTLNYRRGLIAAHKQTHTCMCSITRTGEMTTYSWKPRTHWTSSSTSHILIKSMMFFVQTSTPCLPSVFSALAENLEPQTFFSACLIFLARLIFSADQHVAACHSGSPEEYEEIFTKV